MLESDVALSPDATGGYYLDISAAADLARYFDRCRAYPAAAHLVVRTNNSIWRDEMRGRLAAQELRHTAEAGGRWEWWEIGLLAGGVGVVSAAVGIGVGVGWAMSF